MITKGRVYSYDEGSRSIPRALLACEATFGANLNDLKRSSKEDDLASIRAIVMCHLRNSGVRASAIARLLEMDHTSVLHHCKNHDERLEVDRDYRASWEAFNNYMK